MIFSLNLDVLPLESYFFSQNASKDHSYTSYLCADTNGDSLLFVVLCSFSSRNSFLKCQFQNHFDENIHHRKAVGLIGNNPNNNNVG